MVRTYVESITGIYTGSDGDLRVLLHRDLMEKGLQGEGLQDARVWLVKTHFPESSTVHSFKAERAVLCVRNPLDAIVS